ncbi:hypothetical protein E4T42_01119 [Aureobasidium subglaciale]|nr:hypothetical protein E4T42_01119 [Aureobasidium subglaciale]
MADDTVSHEQRHMLLSLIERYKEVNNVTTTDTTAMPTPVQIDFDEVAAKTGIDTAAQAEQALNHILQKIAISGEDVEVCKWPGCQEIFSTSIELRDHLMTHTAGLRGAERIEQCRWPGCTYEKTLTTRWSIHFINHVSDKGFHKCQRCSKSFSRASDFNKHNKEKHPSLAPAQETEAEADAEVGDEDGEEVEVHTGDETKGAVEEKTKDE